jgi:hypothetical protein
MTNGNVSAELVVKRVEPEHGVRADVVSGEVQRANIIIGAPRGGYNVRPYPETGVVVAVLGPPPHWERAFVDFRNNQPPREYVHLLVVRESTVIGRLQVAPDVRYLWILEGAPQLGDLVIGIQNERNYKK